MTVTSSYGSAWSAGRDLGRDTQDTATASTIEATLAYVRDWLELFAISAL